MRCRQPSLILFDHPRCSQCSHRHRRHHRRPKPVRCMHRTPRSIRAREFVAERSRIVFGFHSTRAIYLNSGFIHYRRALVKPCTISVAMVPTAFQYAPTRLLGQMDPRRPSGCRITPQRNTENSSRVHLRGGHWSSIGENLQPGQNRRICLKKASLRLRLLSWTDAACRCSSCSPV